MKFYSSISFFLLLFLPVNLLLAQTEKRFTQDDIDKIHKEIISINDQAKKLNIYRDEIVASKIC